jgi:hypothetical protein
MLAAWPTRWPRTKVEQAAAAGQPPDGRHGRRDEEQGQVITALGVTQILAWGSSYYLRPFWPAPSPPLPGSPPLPSAASSRIGAAGLFS